MADMHSTRRSFILQGMGALALVASAALIAWKYTVRPLEKREAEIAREFAALGDRLGEARQSIKEVQVLEHQVIFAEMELAALHRENPAEPALVWFPMQVKEQFQKLKVADPTMRVSTNRDVPELPGYTQILWAAEMPVARASRDIRNALFAILEIEAANPFARVADIAIGPDPADSSRHIASADITLLVPTRSARQP